MSRKSVHLRRGLFIWAWMRYGMVHFDLRHVTFFFSLLCFIFFCSARKLEFPFYLLLGSEAAASLFAVQDSFNKCVPWDDRNTIQANDEYYVIKKIFASNIQRCLITYL